MAILSIDLVIVSFLTFFYVKIKNFKPDWFFPPSGLTFFLPPEENDLKELRQDKELSQKKMNSFQRKKFSVTNIHIYIYIFLYILTQFLTFSVIFF